MPRKTTRRVKDKDLLGMQPTDDYKNPSAPRYKNPRGKTYTSGTYNEKLTGSYYTNAADKSLSDSRPISHGKKLGRNVARVTRGALVTSNPRAAARETIDGFLATIPKHVAKQGIKNRKKPPRRR